MLNGVTLAGEIEPVVIHTKMLKPLSADDQRVLEQLAAFALKRDWMIVRYETRSALKLLIVTPIAGVMRT